MDIKVADFGISVKLESEDERRRTICGTPNIMAPEIIRHKSEGHYYPADMWSFGCIFYQMLVGVSPFLSDTIDNTYKRIENIDFKFPDQVKISDEAKQLI